MPFLIFLVVPLIELYLLMTIGARIGLLPTLGTIVLTAAVGSTYVRRQGLAILRELQIELSQGGLPGRQVVEGMLVAVAGLLLLTPGFLTDAVGFAMLMPSIRSRAATTLLQRFSHRVVHMRPPGTRVRPEDPNRLQPRASEIEIIDDSAVSPDDE